MSDGSERSSNPIVSYALVAAAAQAMLSSGVHVSAITAGRLRDQAGHGGNTTWHRHLTKWKEQIQSPAAAPAENMPPQFSDAGQVALNALWATAHGLATEKAEAERQQRREKESALINEMGDITKDLEEAELKLRDTTSRLDDTSDKLAQAVIEREKAEAGRSQLSEEVRAHKEQIRGMRQQLNTKIELLAASEANLMTAQQQGTESQAKSETCLQELSLQAVAYEKLAGELRIHNQTLKQAESARLAAEEALSDNRDLQRELAEKLAAAKRRIAELEGKD